MDLFRNSVESLLSDNTSGSGDMLAALIRSDRDLASRSEGAEDMDTGSFCEQLIRIRKEKPVFLVLQHFTCKLLQLCQERSSLSAADIGSFLDDFMI